MLQFVLVLGFFIIAISIFAVGLHISKYKKRADSGCCGGGHCDTDRESHSCYSEKSKFVDNYSS